MAACSDQKGRRHRPDPITQCQLVSRGGIDRANLRGGGCSTVLQHAVDCSKHGLARSAGGRGEDDKCAAPLHELEVEFIHVQPIGTRSCPAPVQGVKRDQGGSHGKRHQQDKRPFRHCWVPCPGGLDGRRSPGLTPGRCEPAEPAGRTRTRVRKRSWRPRRTAPPPQAPGPTRAPTTPWFRALP